MSFTGNWREMELEIGGENGEAGGAVRRGGEESLEMDRKMAGGIAGG